MSVFIEAVQRVIDTAWQATHSPADRPAIKNENELRPMTVDELADAVREALGGGSSAGINVTPQRALQTASYWTSVLVIAESVAMLPFNVRRRTDRGRGSEIATDVPLHKLLAKRGQPNEWQSSFDFRHLMVWQLCNRGNFYAFKNIVRGELRELIPVHPTRIKPEQDSDFRLTYRLTGAQGGQRTLTRKDLFHVMGASDDGFQGLPPMGVMSEAIGLAIAQDTHAGKLFTNGARLGGAIKHPSTLSDKAYDRLKKWFQETYAGPENAHKTAILEEGMDWVTVAQTAEDAQLMESRRLQRSIVASQRRVPAHMVGDLDKATFSNIENLARQFVDFTLMPWLERIEPACDRQLLTERERDEGLFSKFNVDALLRGDSLTRARFYMLMIQMRAMNPNEVREKEDLNPYEDGDKFENPNTTGNTADDPSNNDDPNRESAPADERRAQLSVVDTGAQP